jgi:hypothetical protein
MKAIVALVLLAALGVGAAGCASAKRVTKKGGSVSIDILTTTESGSKEFGISFGKGYKIDRGIGGATITVTHSATIPHVLPGTLVRCKGGEKVTVTKRVRINRTSTGDYGVDEGGSRSGSTRERHIELRHFPNGTVTVTCN